MHEQMIKERKVKSIFGPKNISMFRKQSILHMPKEK